MRGRSGLSRMIVVVTLAGGALRFKATRDGRRRVVATRASRTPGTVQSMAPPSSHQTTSLAFGEISKANCVTIYA